MNHQHNHPTDLIAMLSHGTYWPKNGVVTYSFGKSKENLSFPDYLKKYLPTVYNVENQGNLDEYDEVEILEAGEKLISLVKDRMAFLMAQNIGLTFI